MEIFDNTLMTLALGGLAVSLALFASAWLYPHLRRAWDKATALARAAFCGACVAACLFGGAKHKTGGISYPKTDTDVAYLIDAGSYVTNDAVHVTFTRVPTVPDTATFYLDYCALDGTNAQGVATNWVNAKTATFGELEVPFDFAFANATNYNWLAYTDWTPGPAVQTNGVWHAYWGIDKKEGRYFIPVRTCVRDGGEVIATPKSKWDAAAEAFYTNCVAWVADDAAAGLADGATVSTWTSNDGRAATSGLKTPTIALGSFNGHAGVSCTNGYFDVSAANNPLAGETQWTVCAVLKTSKYGKTDVSWFNMNGAFGTERPSCVNDWSIIKNASGNLGFGMGVKGGWDYKLMGDANCVDGLPHVVIVSLSHDGTLTLAVDGAVKTLAIMLGADKSPRLAVNIYIGMNFSTSQIFGGEIAELRVYQGTPASAAQRNRIGSELAKKYGATWNAE